MINACWRCRGEQAPRGKSVDAQRAGLCSEHIREYVREIMTRPDPKDKRRTHILVEPSSGGIPNPERNPSCPPQNRRV